MKNKYIYLFTIFSTISLQGTSVNEIAEMKVHYPGFYYHLLDKVHTFLKQKEIQMAVAVQELRSKDLWHEADYFEDQNFYALEAMRFRFDKEFDRIDKKYEEIGLRLDDEDAPNKVKAQFVDAVKADAKASINALIEHYQG